MSINTVAYNVVTLTAIALGFKWLVAIPRRGTLSAGAFARLGFVAVALGGVSLLGALLFGGSIFGMMGLLAWAVFMHLPILLVGAGVLLVKQVPAVSVALWVAAALIALVAVDGFLIEPRWLEVSRVEVVSPNVTEPLRVVVLADVQTDRPETYEARVFKTAMAQRPDLILFAGDYIQQGRRSRSYEAEVMALNDLLLEAGVDAPLGVYAIPGNVDHPGVWRQVFQGLNARTIQTTTRYDLGPVVLTGLDRADAFGTHVHVAAEDKFHIVLGHSPNFSLADVDADLLIAGHTHGGQVRLPLIGPLLTLSVVPRDWAAGVTEIAPGKTLVVSRGIGMERGAAPRFRFLCRPELVVIDVIPE